MKRGVENWAIAFKEIGLGSAAIRAVSICATILDINLLIYKNAFSAYVGLGGDRFCLEMRTGQQITMQQMCDIIPFRGQLTLRILLLLVHVRFHPSNHFASEQSPNISAMNCTLSNLWMFFFLKKKNVSDRAATVDPRSGEIINSDIVFTQGERKLLQSAPTSLTSNQIIIIIIIIIMMMIFFVVQFIILHWQVG
jgi:hypothetical protein